MSDNTRTFGRYEVLRALGRGAVGEVYLANDPVLGRQVAVKTLSGIEGLPEDEQAEVRARFLREARAAASLSHPHIVTIHDVGEAEGVPFLAMEYLRGTTLDRHVKDGHRLPAPKVLELGVQAALALDEAHRHGLVHRDVKPANLMLQPDGSVKVADFGLAKGAESALTSRDTLMGTPNYMAPEQIAGRPLDGRADLFSLAVSLYELLTGQRPFGGDTVSSVLYRIVNDPPRPLSELRPDLPHDLEAFFERALAKDPEQRPATAGVFASELRQILRQMGGVPADLHMPPPGDVAGRATAPTVAHRGEEVRRPAPLRTVAIVVGVVLLLVVAVWTAPLWLGVDPLGGARRPLEDGLAQVLGPVGRAIRTTAPDRLIPIETVPPDLPVIVTGGSARLAANDQLLVPGTQKEPFKVEARDACRTASETVDPAQPPARLRLVAVPKTVTAHLATTPAGASVTVNGEPAPGVTPLDLALPACQGNQIAIAAPGRAPVTVQLGSRETPDEWQKKLAAVTLPAGATPAAAAATTEAAPAPPPSREGRVVVPAPPGYAAEVLSKGKKLGSAGGTFTLPSGAQVLQLVNREVLLDVEVTVHVTGGATTRTAIEWPALGALTVRAVPPGGKVLAAPAGGAPREIGTTPLNSLPVVAGEYEVTVENPVTGAHARQAARVAGGANAVVRVTQEDWR